MTPQTGWIILWQGHTWLGKAIRQIMAYWNWERGKKQEFSFFHAVQETIKWNRKGSRLEGKYWKNFELQEKIEKKFGLLAYFIIPFIDGYHQAGILMVVSVLLVGYVSVYVDWEITRLPLDVWFPIIWMVVYGLAFEYSYNWIFRKPLKK